MVGRPERTHQNDPAMDWAQTVFADLRAAVGRSGRDREPAFVVYSVLCSHQGTLWDGGRTDLYVRGDWRVLA